MLGPEQDAAATPAQTGGSTSCWSSWSGSTPPGGTERVLRATLLAADDAWVARVGLLSGLRLERTVVHAVRGAGVVTVDGGRRAGRVLHVLSEAYGTGSAPGRRARGRRGTNAAATSC